MFMLHSRLAATRGHRDDLLAVLAQGEGLGERVEGERAEPMPGCRLYLVAVDESDPDGVWVTEVWESAEAHRAALQLERVQEQIARATPFLDPEGLQDQTRRQVLDARSGIPG